MLQGSRLSSNWRDFPCSLSPLAKLRLVRRTASMPSWKISVLSIRGFWYRLGGSPQKNREVPKRSIRVDFHIENLAGFTARVESPVLLLLLLLMMMLLLLLWHLDLGKCFLFLTKCYGTVGHVESVLPIVLDSIAVMSRGWCHRAKMKQYHFNG